MEDVEKQFISVLNLDCQPFNDSEYNCIFVIRNGYANDESIIFDEEDFQQIMAFQDAIPYCCECASYDYLTADCPQTMVESSKMWEKCIISSNVMPSNQQSHIPAVAPEPPPVDRQIVASSIKDGLIQKATRKVTRGLYDSGVDDHTTNDPFIIFKLWLLPKQDWTTLYNVGKKPHVSRYGGELYLRMKSGKMK